MYENSSASVAVSLHIATEPVDNFLFPRRVDWGPSMPQRSIEPSLWAGAGMFRCNLSDRSHDSLIYCIITWNVAIFCHAYDG